CARAHSSPRRSAGAAFPAGRWSGRDDRAPPRAPAAGAQAPPRDPTRCEPSGPPPSPPKENTMRLAHRLLLVALLLLLAAPRARAQSPLRLNEFLAGPARDWDGSGTLSTRDDEWIEVMNLGGTPLDLAGYLLTDGDKLPRFAFSGTLAAGSVRVVYGKE